MKVVIVNRSLRYRGKFYVVMKTQKGAKGNLMSGTPTLIMDGAEKKEALNTGLETAKKHKCVLVVKTEMPDPRSSQIGAD